MKYYIIMNKSLCCILLEKTCVSVCKWSDDDELDDKGGVGSKEGQLLSVELDSFC